MAAVIGAQKAMRYLRDNGYLGHPSQELIRAGDAAAPPTPTVEEIMEVFDAWAEEAVLRNEILIAAGRGKFIRRLTKLHQQKGQAPSSKGE